MKNHWAYLALVGVLVACGDDGTSSYDSRFGDAGGDDGLPPGVAGSPGMAGAPGTGGFPSATTGGTTGAGGVQPGGSGGDPGTGGFPTDGAGGDLGTGGSPTGGAGGDLGTGGSPTGGAGGTTGTGTCCSDGDCLCHGPAPTRLTSSNGPYNTNSYSLRGTGCIYYPTNAEAPFAAVAISDGYLGTGGCGRSQTSGWGPFYASHGIVTMIIETTGSDQPRTRGTKLLRGIAGFKSENQNASSPLYQKLAGRYGTSGFSMGGGGTTYAASEDPSLLTSVAIMPWSPTGRGMTVPTLVICGSTDRTASCASHGQPLYDQIPSSTPKMRVTVTSGHNGQPTAGSGLSGARGLAFQKVFLEGDERWRSVLLSGSVGNTNIQ